MGDVVIFFGILGAVLAGAMSPGPSFILVSRIAVHRSRRDGLFAALGMGLGSALFAVLALVGLVALLVQVPWLYLALKVLGGLYLVFLGIQMWRSSRKPLVTDTPDDKRTVRSATQAALTAFTTQVANPKTAIVYAGIFASLMPADPSGMFVLLLPLAVFLVEAGWYAGVALVFAAPAPQSFYVRWKTLWDRLAGFVIGALGMRLAVGDLEWSAG